MIKQIPNVVGFIFGMVQMIVFIIYKDGKKVISSDENIPKVSMLVDVVKPPPNTRLDEIDMKIPQPESLLINNMKDYVIKESDSIV